MTKVCPKCGTVNLNEALRCDSCGSSLVNVPPEGVKTAEVCPACGAISPLGAKRCGSCGKDFEEEIAKVNRRNRNALVISISIVVIAILLFALFVPYNHA
ncbi:MAG TPA: zinc ribbon domain-containing protein, partial [Methanomassiliicoccales archaeon]|nr:zinc ribbon domain-containing protein [Methanomassiliicoccales archaeon]